MARFDSLRNLATQVLKDIDDTPLLADASTQTDDVEDEEIVSLLRKRKNEILYVIDDFLRDKKAETTFTYNLNERRLSTGKSAPTKALIAASNYVDCTNERETDAASDTSEKDTDVSADSVVDSDLESIAHTTGKKSSITFDTDVQEDACTRRRKKLLREVAAIQGVEYDDDRRLLEIYKGRTNEDLVNMMPESSPEPTQRTLKVDFTGIIDVQKISLLQYSKLSKDGKNKYVAAVIIRLKQLVETHGPPLSLRAISTMYNIDYNTFYDSWSGRRSNQYIT